MEARDRGLPAYAETCPQYLFLARGRSTRRAGRRVRRARSTCARRRCGPKHHHDHLWRGLRNYDLQVVSTDHCPFCMKEQKELGRGDFSKIPNGMPGVETRLHLLWEGVRAGPDLAEPLRRDHVDRAGEDLRPVPEEGHDRRRRRRRRRRVGSGEALRAVAQEPAHEGRLRRRSRARPSSARRRTCCRAASWSSRTTSGSGKKGPRPVRAPWDLLAVRTP